METQNLSEVTEPLPRPPRGVFKENRVFHLLSLTQHKQAHKPWGWYKAQTGGILKMERKIFPLGAGAKKRLTKKCMGSIC